MEKRFKLKEKGTNVKTEIIAGATTFATMAYIMAVNSSILSDAGLDAGAVFTATALSAAIGTIAMGLLANMPFAMAPGMGMNAFFAYSVIIGMGYGPQLALAAVFIEGIIFIILSKTGIRTKLFNAIPLTLKYAVGAGIGLFIMFIGLANAGVVVADPATLVTIGNLKQPAVAIALIGVVVIIVLLARKVKGALLIGILISWLIGIIAQFTGWYQIDPAAGAYNLLPTAVVSAPPSLASTFGLCFSGIKEAFSGTTSFLTFFSVMFTFLFVDIFDTLGFLAGIATKAKMLNEKGELEDADKALLADAIGTTAGAILGTSTVTTYLESAAGVQEGGRTGLTSLVTSAFFLLSLFFSPIFLTIPSFATAPALIIVGIFMIEPVMHLKLDDFEDSIPLGLTLISMPLFYSISHGLAFGLISYVIVKSAVGKFKEVSGLMWVLTIVFLFQMVLH
ncbi:MAG: NCS2 family permease [Oscillospiraceae bacterium]|nr:NCS2 family permease [Oscillospiraceae bacterium]